MITQSPPKFSECRPLLLFLTACVLTGCEFETVPAAERDAPTPEVGAGAPYDPEEDVPPSLKGFRSSPIQDWTLYLHGDSDPWLWDVMPEARAREDFRRGARECVSNLVAGKTGWRLLTMGVFESKQEQAWWRGRMRAKEVEYGPGAEEAACEREFLRMALLVARGDWRGTIESAHYRDEFLREVESEREWLERQGKAWEERDRFRFFPGDAKMVARLEEWLGVRP